MYDYIQECDNILIASPIYFSQLTGQLLAVASRLQMYFSAKYFRKEIPIAKTKNGGVILVGGGDGHIGEAYKTACILLHHMNSKNIEPVILSHNTDKVSSKEDNSAINDVKSLAMFFNEK